MRVLLYICTPFSQEEPGVTSSRAPFKHPDVSVVLVRGTKHQDIHRTAPKRTDDRVPENEAFL